jgi:hypothetical protein
MNKYHLYNTFAIGVLFLCNSAKAEEQQMDNSFNYSPYLESSNQVTNEQLPINNNSNNQANYYNTVPVKPLEASVSTNTTPISSSPNPDNKVKPLQKVSDWVNSKRKYNQTGKPEVDLANQRIRAGKARLRAVKAKEKLDKFITQSQSDIERLTKEAQTAESEAALIENQIRFQESNNQLPNP